MALTFGFWSEQETQVGQSYARRLHELVDEVRLAEKVGFDCIALSEQHVALGGISSSAPEVVYRYLAAVTSRVKLRSAVTLMPQRCRVSPQNDPHFHFALTHLEALKHACKLGAVLVRYGQREMEKRVKPGRYSTGGRLLRRRNVIIPIGAQLGGLADLARIVSAMMFFGLADGE
jgi:Luciferase-like monooxygenase